MRTVSFYFTIFTLGILVLSGCSHFQKNGNSSIQKKELAHRFFTKARENILHNKPNQAIDFYKISFAYDPQSLDLPLLISELYFQQNILDSSLHYALKTKSNILKEQPIPKYLHQKYQRVYQNIAQLYLKLQDDINAIQYYKELYQFQKKWNFAHKQTETLYSLYLLSQKSDNIQQQIWTLKELLPLTFYSFDILKILHSLYLKTPDSTSNSWEAFLEVLWQQTKQENIGITLANYWRVSPNIADKKKARTLCTQLSKLHPHKNLHKECILHTWIKEEQFDSAKIYLSNTLSKDLYNAKLRQFYGILLLQLQLYISAEQQFQILTQQDSNNGEFYYYLGISQENLASLLEKDSSKNHSQIQKVDSIATLAIQSYQQSTQKDSTSLKYWEKLGYYSLSQKENHKAYYAFNKIQSLSTDSSQPHYRYGMLLNQLAEQESSSSQKLELYKQALSHFKSASKISPKKEPILLGLGVLLEKIGNTKESIAVFKDLTLLDSKNGLYWNNLGYLLTQNNQNLDSAIIYIDKALELEPENSAYLDSKGWWYYKKNNYVFAKKFIEKAYLKNNNDPTILKHLIETLEAIHDSPTVCTYLEQVLQLKPQNIPSKCTLFKKIKHQKN